MCIGVWWVESVSGLFVLCGGVGVGVFEFWVRALGLGDFG